MLYLLLSYLFCFKVRDHVPFKQGFRRKGLTTKNSRSSLGSPPFLLSNRKAIFDLCQGGAHIETDDARSYFLLEIPCREGVETRSPKKSELKATEKTTEKIIKAIQNNPYITHRDLAEILGLSEDGIYYNIKKLKQKGLLRRIGPDKGGHWEVLV